MPRYHVKITASDTKAVEKEVAITFKKGEKSGEVIADLHAKSPEAAKQLVLDRLPAGSGANVSDPVQVPD